MRGLIRHLLMWLLALALPWQGAAAATGLHCAHAQRATIAASSSATDGGAHEAHHAAHAHAGHHHGASTTTAHAHEVFASSDALSSAHDSAAPASQDGCSACASCCPAVAMPVAALVVSQVPHVEAAPPVVCDVIVMFLTGGPERPPRSFLA
jgi:hypothetical protein